MGLKGTTHYEYVGDGYSVQIVHCRKCGEYLGVNYPADVCDSCKPYVVIAYNDKVGVVCSDECGAAAMHDINADNDYADAGCEPASSGDVKIHGPICMGCGKEIKS